MAVRISTAEEYEALLRDYDTWLFDCDGVLWRGDHSIEGVIQVLDMLRRRNKKVIFVTNNATKSRQTLLSKFEQLGVQAHADEVYGSAYAAAVYVSSVLKMPKTKKAYVIGMAGLEEELRSEGIAFLGGTDLADNTLESFDLGTWKRDPDVGAVICGLDTKINYTKLSKAFQYLLNDPECHFIETNEDSTYPSAHGLLPGAGSISAPLRCAIQRAPVICGKPSTTMLDSIQAKVHFDPKRTIMVGDRLNTDIQFGQNGGLSTLLVLTGITSEADITGPNASPIVPDFVTQSLGDLRAADKAP
ncbi:p-nitrophenyl phosphatase [Coprinellus micaceus]|uniref:4-nitrophenylphosphatase n=1 Tax=Coprinellus micaceus TaxID=71717 RepID=A0A4Y7TFS8_COPMI|nr:p-nitrophenyl phosphatase [Coprinellus micaceus]